MGQLTSMPSPIAVVGTTSSGKSTLCNLLCSRSLLPTGVQETTTHIVDIFHDSTCESPLLVVADLDHSSAIERCTSDDAGARHQLAQLMASPGVTKHICLWLSLTTNNNHWFHTGNGLPPSVDMIGLPLRYAIPMGSGCLIRDFPGVQHVGDNARIALLEQFLDPHSIVMLVFNAEETDHTKEERLLRGVFQVMCEKQMSSDAALFVLNRKDAFERDRDPARGLRQRLDQIRGLLTRLMREYWHVPLADDAVVACSAGQMFSAEMACWYRHLLESPERKHTERQFIYAVDYLIETGAERLSDMRSWNPEVVWSGYCAIRRRSGIDHLLGQLRARLGI
jgi:predicted GTPase